MEYPKRYTVTAALPYANGPLHIGHLAGVYVPADIFVRYLRARNREVLFVCGSDEHGAAITLRAKKEGISPQEIVDKYHQIIRDSFAEFGIDFDIYHRTSTDLHRKTASDFFLRLVNRDSFEQRDSMQFYDPEADQFLADRYITGTCPVCGYGAAYGDQCEKCGSSLNPEDLKDPRSAISGSTPVQRKTSHWYLPMNKHEEWLRDWIEKGTLNGIQQHDPQEWKRQVKGQCMSWINGGLQPRAMTRDLDWGVPVPLPNSEGKVLYVWLDAPIGYISASIQWAKDTGKDWQPYWKEKDSKLIHFLAKDNIVFHGIIFPILLKQHGDFILPDNVPANEFLNLEGDKISTSRNWAVWLHEYLADFPGRQDELRYVLNAVAPEFRDSEFTWFDFQARVNNELVASFGNFVNRTLVLIEKYFDGVIPQMQPGNEEKNLLNHIPETAEKVAGLIESYRFREAQAEAMNLARIGNKYLTETEPWKAIKTDESKAATILNFCAQLCAALTIVLDPFLPHSTEKLRQMLGMQKLNWAETAKTEFLQPGHKLNKPELLYKRVEDAEVQHQIEKLQMSKEQTTVKQAPQKPDVSFEDFQKMDLRIGVIEHAEKIPKADKLLKLEVNTGLDRRTIVSGIAQHFSPEEIIGKSVVVLLNLPPRKLRGVESQGMLLMAENADGALSFLQPSKATEAGSTVS